MCFHGAIYLPADLFMLICNHNRISVSRKSNEAKIIASYASFHSIFNILQYILKILEVQDFCPEFNKSSAAPFRVFRE